MGTFRLVRLGVIAIAIVLACAGSLSAQPSASAPATARVSTSWTTEERTLVGGRTFFVRVPSCSPARSPGCRRFLELERAVVVFLHGANGPEDRDTASRWLAGLHAQNPETIFAFGVSEAGSRRWDAGFCCTSEPVDDVGYLARVVDNIARGWAVDRRRAGVTGFSNGGMLALRATCERPELFAAAAALAATYDGACDVGRTSIGQWHGGRDSLVPLNGGTVTIVGAQRTLPPVASLAQRMAAGSLYVLRVLPKRAHAMSWLQFRQSTRWLVSTLRG